ELAIDANAYEGPMGILGLLAVSSQWRGLRSINLWVGVPDYLAESPSPKAELALVKAVERFTGVEIDIHVLEEESRAWELGADELVSFNPHLAELVKGLEKQNDSADLPEAAGAPSPPRSDRNCGNAAAGNDPRVWHQSPRRMPSSASTAAATLSPLTASGSEGSESAECAAHSSRMPKARGARRGAVRSSRRMTR